MPAVILPDNEIIGKVSDLKLSPARATQTARGATRSSVARLAKLSSAAPLLLYYADSPSTRGDRGLKEAMEVTNLLILLQADRGVGRWCYHAATVGSPQLSFHARWRSHSWTYPSGVDPHPNPSP